MPSCRRLLAPVALAALLGPAAAVQAAGAWSITDIGVLAEGPFAYSTTTAINGLGQVVGMSRNAAGANRAFLWTPGQGMRDLGDLPGGIDMSIAHALNDSGVAAGSSTIVNDLLGTHAFRWTAGGGMVDLGARPTNSYYSQALGINAAGTVVGWTGLPAVRTTAFLQTAGGGMTLLTTPAGSSTQANAINDAGTVVGFTMKSNGTTRATVWAGGSRSELPDLPGGADHSTALAINASGLVVGSSAVTGGGHAFAWTALGGMVDLGDLPGGDVASTAWGVNDAGDIVGTGSSQGQAQHALLWRGGQIIDLGALPEVQAAGWTLAQAMDINNQGQITGLGWLGGQQRGFVLSPVAAPVPEPSSWLLLAVGGLALLARRRAVGASS